MAGNEQVLTAVLRLRDEMSPQISAPKRALGGLQDGFVQTESSAVKSFAHIQQSAQALSRSVTSGFQQIVRSMQGANQSGEQFATAFNRRFMLLKALASTVNFSGTFNATQKGIEGTTTAFEMSERAQAKFAQRISTLTNKMLGLHFVTQTLGSRLGKGEFGREVSAASDALMVFGGIVSIMPNKIGLAVGAAAGLGVALFDLLQPSEKVKEALEKVNQNLEQLGSHRRSLEERGLRSNIEDAAKQAAGFPTTDVDRARRERDRLLDKLVTLQRELDVRVKDRTLIDNDATGLNAKKLAEMRKEIEETERALKAANAEFKEFERVAGDAKEVKEFTKTIDDLNERSKVAAESLEAGLTTPAKEAAEQLEITDAKLKALFAIKDKLQPGQFEQFKDIFSRGRGGLVEAVEMGKVQEEADKKRRQQEEEARREAEKRALKELENQWGVALPMAVDEYVQSMKTAKDFMVEMFQATQGAMTTAFESLLSGGKRAKDALKNFIKDMKSSLIRSVSEMMSQAVMKQFLGLLGFGGAPGGVASVDPRAAGGTGGGAAGAMGGAGGGVNLGSLGGMFGLDASTGASIAGGIAGAAIGIQGVKAGNTTQSTAGMAMAGMAIGAIAGPIGAVAGLAIGAIAGAIMGSRAKRRAKKKRRAAEAAARAAHEAAVERARVVLKQDIRNKMGGGLATEEAANEIGQLFSGGLSEEEILKFGDPSSIAARANDVNRQSTVNAPISVTAYINGRYDVEILARDLGGYLESQMGGPASDI